MRKLFAVLSAVALLTPHAKAVDVDLGAYTCKEFIADTKSPSDGNKLIRSLMMISWSAGYAAAFQRTKLRADPKAIQLIAAALGDACRRSPEQLVVEVISREIMNLSK